MKGATTNRRVTTHIIASLALVALIVHLMTIHRYGYFRDELYYIACARHLDFGYVDLAPLSAFLLRIELILFGSSLFALRIFPALASALTIVLTGILTRELGGRAWAIALACTSMLGSLFFLAVGNFYSPNVYEPLFWTGAIYLLCRIVNGAPSHTWLWFGVVVGFGIQNKHSMVFFGVAIVLAILLTPQRRQFAQKWIWLGGLIALVIALPNIIWQIDRGWPTWVLLHGIAKSNKNVVLSPWEFFFQQITLMNPALSAVVRRVDLAARLPRRPALPRHRFHLLNRSHRIRRHAREELLPGPGLSDVICGGWRCFRETFRTALPLA